MGSVNSQPQALLFGHRGAAGEAPENTLPAFQRALELGMDGIELDVLRCRSGEIVAAHDLTLRRLIPGHGRVKSYTYPELKTLDVGSHFSPRFMGERIPRLEEVLDQFGSRMWLDIEIKGRSIRTDGIEEQIVRLLQERKLFENVILSSFNPFIARRVQVLDSRLKVGFNYLQDFYAPLRRIWFRPLALPFSLHPQPAQVDQAFLAYAQKIKAKVLPWGVNEPAEIQRLLDLGVDGLISDYPSRLKSQIQK
jgi:glycerophosphoryl diester phosphodiesterase